MKIKGASHKLILIAILYGWGGSMLIAQTPFDSEYGEEASKIREQVQLFTDRSLYAVDETIYFVAEHRVSGPIGENPWSSVLYVELISSGGQPLVQGKFQISGGKAEGMLHIPDESLTGNYYLKAYTRWMRNQGPGSFSYAALKIINPFRSEVIERTNMEGPATPAQKAIYRDGILKCSTASPSYKPGEEVLIELKGTGAYQDILNCCVTVLPEGAMDLPGKAYVPVPHEEGDSFRVRFLPDLGKAVSISGTVVDSSHLPQAYVALHFSLLGKSPDFYAAMSNEKGKFVLTAPSGAGETKEYFVTPDQEEGRGLEVRIDEEFDSRTVSFPGEPFRLSEEESGLARRIALNMQLSRVFMPDTDSKESSPSGDISEGSRIPFYGTRVKRLLIDDYVMLPNLEEVFINLVPEIQFYKKKGVTKIRILSENRSIEVYNPLIMIDHVSVFDHQALLAISPEKIERIDLINEIYLKGNVAFGGILAIHSRKGDMAGIDLPKGSYFFDYQSFNSEFKSVEALPSLDARMPDTRNTFLWKGELNLEQGMQQELKLKAPADSGTYEVLVRGVLPSGELYSAKTKFRVDQYL